VNTFIRICLISLLLLLTPLLCQGEIYKYVDKNGRTIFVDDASRIPQEYRQQSEHIKEARPSAPASEDSSEEDETTSEAVAADPKTFLDAASMDQAKLEAKQEEKQRAYRTPVMISGSRVMVPVEIATGARTGHLVLLLDVNSPSTVLYRSSLTQFELPKGEPIEVQTGGTRKFKGRSIPFDYLKTGPLRMERPNLSVIELNGQQLPYDGVLGTDFLGEHPYQLDERQQVIFWEMD